MHIDHVLVKFVQKNIIIISSVSLAQSIVFTRLFVRSFFTGKTVFMYKIVQLLLFLVAITPIAYIVFFIKAIDNFDFDFDFDSTYQYDGIKKELKQRRLLRKEKVTKRWYKLLIKLYT